MAVGSWLCLSIESLAATVVRTALVLPLNAHVSDRAGRAWHVMHRQVAVPCLTWTVVVGLQAGLTPYDHAWFYADKLGGEDMNATIVILRQALSKPPTPRTDPAIADAIEGADLPTPTPPTSTTTTTPASTAKGQKAKAKQPQTKATQPEHDRHDSQSEASVSNYSDVQVRADFMRACGSVRTCRGHV